MLSVIEEFRHEQDMEIADLATSRLLRGVERHCAELDASLAHFSTATWRKSILSSARTAVAATSCAIAGRAYRVVINERSKSPNVSVRAWTYLHQWRIGQAAKEWRGAEIRHAEARIVRQAAKNWRRASPNLRTKRCLSGSIRRVDRGSKA